jgi:hypothetical protein
MFFNIIFLVLSRPIYTFGSAILIYPSLLGISALSYAYSHEFLVPFSRLTYGAFLFHGVFMLFRSFDVERGQWGSFLDAILFFMAYMFIAYVFSFITFLLIESPIKRI